MYCQEFHPPWAVPERRGRTPRQQLRDSGSGASHLPWQRGLLPQERGGSGCTEIRSLQAQPTPLRGPSLSLHLPGRFWLKLNPRKVPPVRTLGCQSHAESVLLQWKTEEPLGSRRFQLRATERGFYFRFFFLVFFKDFIYLFIYLRGKGGRKRGRNINVQLLGAMACNPSMCPDWESNPRHPGSQPALHPRSHASQGIRFFFLKSHHILSLVTHWF
ncbi:hypothetical protein HJG60_012125 [Phyllostomus discolor]|uniref:Uncharacterized protein n=1 Tax=Phyllostomus discolor TaxID=89673 RepID=A0A833ZM04_9CHIR|nr:hypothetical protein HJG60_012125 [Phyllostomus discolor]